MPLYDYKCDRCGPFEVWHKMAETGTPRACVECGAIATSDFHHAQYQPGLWQLAC